MKDEQILQKAIEKAGKNGYEWKSITGELLKSIDFRERIYYKLIFSHDFARHFWGEEDLYMDSPLEHAHGIGRTEKAWKVHLQQMVLEEEPLKYIKKFL